MIAPLHRTPRDIAEARRTVTDPASLLICRQAAWVALKSARGQEVDMARLVAMTRALPNRFERPAS
jgi:hypothetical protein